MLQVGGTQPRGESKSGSASHSSALKRLMLLKDSDVRFRSEMEGSQSSRDDHRSV